VTNSESIYREFVEFEERAATIYLQLASRFSQDAELSSFWLDMAMHEKQHAGLLQFCIFERLFAPGLPDTAELQKFAEFFNRLEKHAVEPSLTVEQAFSLAIKLEVSEINAIYCHLTTSLHSSMYLLRRKIATSLPGHIDDLITAARKFGVGSEVLQELNLEKERFSSQWQPPS